MQSTILHSANFKTSNWSGGTTTQLFIYPPTAEYLQRNFIFRLSTASVKAYGELSVLTIEKHQLSEYQTDKKLSWLFIFAFSGKTNIKSDQETLFLDQGSLLVIKQPDGTKIVIEGIEKSELIFAEILMKK